MARKTIEHITDDFDGSELDPSEVIVETFTVNGVDYSLDLGGKSAAKFDKDMQKWIDKATKIGGRQKRSANKQAPAPTRATTPAAVAGGDKAQLSAVREWARANGYEVSDRGRIPRAIVEEFEAAH
ncbi:histone-like nucleoid-structuring protein Lsr2 [Williamsia soli]|uniref:histone-like nucleoid-structuring protein Lsr2 n=1 Tax=Williamsia soli TaxID=364929 RepID=UPI001A9CBC60|nr:Lsr2 family protein [Williamsia soli]